MKTAAFWPTLPLPVECQNNISQERETMASVYSRAADTTHLLSAGRTNMCKLFIYKINSTRVQKLVFCILNVNSVTANFAILIFLIKYIYTHINLICERIKYNWIHRQDFFCFVKYLFIIIIHDNVVRAITKYVFNMYSCMISLLLVLYILSLNLKTKYVVCR